MALFGRKNVSALALFLAAGSTVVAQAPGSLSGSVKDTKGAPVVGATVMINSPALFAPRTLRTDEKGEWRAPLLPVGYFRVTAVKDGFVSAGAEGIRVGLGASIRQDLTLKPVATAQAVVEVVANAATADKTDTKVGTNFSADTLAVLPAASRGFAGAADLTPGLVSAANGTYSIRGGTQASTGFNVNGSDVKDPIQNVVTNTKYVDDNIEDIQVMLSPLNARYGRNLGGSMNVVTKSGSNDFHGSIRASFQRNNWYADNPSYWLNEGSTSDTFATRLWSITLGGPIVKDRLWFSLATNLRPSEITDGVIAQNYPAAANRVVRTGNANIDAVTLAGPAGYTWTKFDQGAPVKTSGDNMFYEGKLTGSITPDHTVEVGYFKNKVDTNPRAASLGAGATLFTGSTSRLAALGAFTSTSQNYTFNYKGMLSNNIFLEARYNKLDGVIAWPQGDRSIGGNELILVYAGSTLNTSRQGLSYPFGQGTGKAEIRSNRSGNINLKVFHSVFGGDHELDAGYDYYLGQWMQDNHSGDKNQIIRTGGAYVNAAGQYLFPTINLANGFLQDSTGLRGMAASLVQYYGEDGMLKNFNHGIYVNDSWTINANWNMMLGFRFDKNIAKNTDGTQIGSSTAFTPRFQLKFDPKGDGSHVFTFTAARFQGDYAMGITSLVAKTASAKSASLGWSANPAPGSATDPLGLYGVRFIDYAALTNAANYGTLIGFSDNSKNNKIAPGLKAPYQDEFTLGYQRSWANGNKVKFTFVHREWKQDWGIESIYDTAHMDVVTDPSGLTTASSHTQVTDIFNSDDLVRRYNGLEIDWTKRINSIWTMGGNWTISRLTGNTNGGDARTSSFQATDSNVTYGYYFNRAHLISQGIDPKDFAPDGPLLNDIPMRGRLYVTATVPMGKGQVTFSLLGRYSSGDNFDAAANAAMPGLANIPADAQGIYPNAPTAYFKYYGGRGTLHRNDTWGMDFKLAFSMPLGWRNLAIMGDISVNNLLNHIEPFSYERAFYSPDGGQPALYANNSSTWGTTQPQLLTNKVDYWNAGRSVDASIGIRF